MDCSKAGKLILNLRKEKGMTQKQLAEKLNISDKAVSKWERGLGFPDVSVLNDLSKILNVNIEKLLNGELIPNSKDGGNMKKTKFYVCSECGNVTISSGNAEISCCGRKLSAMVAQPCDEEHQFEISLIEDEYYIRVSHDMNKEHYINFVSYVTYDRIMFVRLYAEQGSEIRIPRMTGGKFYFGCSKHGIWTKDDKI